MDLQALQAQLQSERARLANEVSDKFKRHTASSDSGGASSSRQRNPFSLPAQGASSSSSASSPFQHRPITLGLGAEMPQNGNANGNAHMSSNDRRLKGLMTSKKRKNEQERDGPHEEEEESRSSALSNGKGKGKETIRQEGMQSKRSRVADPFAASAKSKKKVETAKAAVATASQGENFSPSNGTHGAAPLSKKALKKLRKQERLAREAEEADDDDDDDEAQEAQSGPLRIPEDADKTEQRGQQSMPATLQLTSDADGQSLTPHQQSMQSKLAGARFRQINESLYTLPSGKALAMIQDEPAIMDDYHRGFRQQVKGWPKVPVRQIYELLVAAQRKTAGAAKSGSAKATQGKRGHGRFAKDPLVIDLGAGEGFLAKWLRQDEPTLDVRVLSYDLYTSADGWVIGADVAQIGALPLPGALMPIGGGEWQDCQACVVDVAVFCLSLMATNWVNKVREAHRVLRVDGELIIAEVTSRFSDMSAFVHLIESLGFTLQSKDSSNTHFVLFHFGKLPRSKCKPHPSLAKHSAEGLVQLGQTLLKPCIYKRR